MRVKWGFLASVRYIAFCGFWLLVSHARLWSRPFFGGFWGWRQVVNWSDRVMIMAAQDDDDYYYCDPAAVNRLVRKTETESDVWQPIIGFRFFEYRTEQRTHFNMYHALWTDFSLSVQILFGTVSTFRYVLTLESVPRVFGFGFEPSSCNLSSVDWPSNWHIDRKTIPTSPQKNTVIGSI